MKVYAAASPTLTSNAFATATHSLLLLPVASSKKKRIAMKTSFEIQSVNR